MLRSRPWQASVLVVAVILAAALPASTYAEQAGSALHRVAAASLAAGSEHTCALLTDGTVECWGSNYGGQLGSRTNLGDPYAANPPAPVPLGAPATAVASGDTFSCALLVTGDVRCWGENRDGELGSTVDNGNDTPVPDPQPAVALGGPAVAISAGPWHVCAILATGAVRCWGANGNGQLGSSTNAGTSTPNPVPLGPVALGSPAVAITTGWLHTCALLSSHVVRCWGGNYSGALGTATDAGTSSIHPNPGPAVPLGADAVAISGGREHSCALLAGGDVRCWGQNYYGQLGSTANNGSYDPNPTPQPAVPLDASAVAISAGPTHTCAVLTTGDVQCWGSNPYGQLGSTTNNGTVAANPPQDPVPVSGGAVAVSAGSEHTCVLTSTGESSCWGRGSEGELGTVPPAGSSAAPVAVPLSGLRVRAAPVLAVVVQPRADRTPPYRFVASGDVKGDFAVDAATCTGRVTVEVLRSDRRLAVRHAPVHRDCSWRARIRVAGADLRPGRNRLTVRAGLAPTTNLAAAEATTRVVAVR